MHIRCMHKVCLVEPSMPTGVFSIQGYSISEKTGVYARRGTERCSVNIHKLRKQEQRLWKRRTKTK